MALDFPTSPTDGQIYNNYYWDDANSRWQLLGGALEVHAAISNTPTGSYTDGYDYEYVSFTSSGTLNVTRGGYADVLLVGGGGSGGWGRGGGGGAGGHLYVENAFLPAGSLDVIVGDGGAAPLAGYLPGFNGSPSFLHKYVAPGGGAGSAMGVAYNGSLTNASPGQNGASGGGAGGKNGGLITYNQGGLGVSGLGFAGGDSEEDCGGGGGGAGAAGANGSGGVGADGGNGVANSITGTSVTRAGGGAGGGNSGGTGGSGGGGDDAVAGTANTGGGGGSTAAGGSGIVIVRVRV